MLVETLGTEIMNLVEFMLSKVLIILFRKVKIYFKESLN